MKQIFSTLSCLIFLSVCSFGQIKFNDAFNITKKRSCYDLNIEKIELSKKKNKADNTISLIVEVHLSNSGNIDFEQTDNIQLELFDLSDDIVKLESWDFNQLEMNTSKTFKWEKTFPEDATLPTTFKSNLVLKTTMGECDLFNNSRLEDF